MSGARLRILQITHQGDIGGSTNSITWLTEGLAGLGHEVHLCCRRESLLHERFTGHPDVRLAPFVFGRNPLRSRTEPRARAPRAGTRHRDRERARLARPPSHDPGEAPSSAGASGSFTREGTCPSRPGEPCRAGYFGACTDRIIAVSGRVADAMAEGGMPREKLVVVHNGIPLDRYREVPEEEVREARAALGAPRGDARSSGCSPVGRGRTDLLRAMAARRQRGAILLLGIDRDDENRSRLAVPRPSAPA